MEGPAGAGGGPEQGGTVVRLPAGRGGSGQAGGAVGSDRGVGTATRLRAGQATDFTAFFGAHRHDHGDTQAIEQGHPGTCRALRPTPGGAGQGVGSLNLSCHPPLPTNPTHPTQCFDAGGIAVPQGALRSSTPTLTPIDLHVGAPTYPPCSMVAAEQAQISEYAVFSTYCDP